MTRKEPVPERDNDAEVTPIKSRTRRSRDFSQTALDVVRKATSPHDEDEDDSPE